ncbi:cystathionine gamma-lyase [Actinokineospora alba]|uniref:Cystathionine gamma-lyase n=1 Tax=Actinokineospora alba TaxID=504798 RepID=A0A1H0I0D8_9PSEU|nr:cystathionine gamma-lyase [Actinokineospora alba]TDP64664.1 cystathionine gamma-lyase [Actinokineospora alba]SDI84645.1 cystathionine gamma-lyase [Actinokineospora alba]SDO24863.1 cystathionine gamma-lyase [Actinokineospora alba]
MTLGDGTRCVHAGLPPAEPGAPVGPQPVLASQFHLGGAHSYGRADNPTWDALESAIGDLDGGTCVVFASGMAATTSLLRTVLRAGDTVVLPSDGYYLTRTYVRDNLAALDLTVRELPTGMVWTADMVEGARLVIVETPSNPRLDVCDIAAVADLAHAAGALMAVDNTTATPLGQRPLSLGADVVFASDTKALAGHSDVVLGHISTADPDLAARLRSERTGSGSVPGPFEVWLAHRGLGTLDLRLARQAENAAAVYEALREHPRIRGIRWPGSEHDPAHELASRQMRRFGGVVTFELESAQAADTFVATTTLVSSATSFGGLHSTADRRARWGDPVPDGLLRFSCGCEDPTDLVADILTALDT